MTHISAERGKTSLTEGGCLTHGPVVVVVVVREGESWSNASWPPGQGGTCSVYIPLLPSSAVSPHFCPVNVPLKPQLTRFHTRPS